MNLTTPTLASTNIVDPATAASLWPQLMSYFDPLGIELIAPSAIDCEGDPNCHNVETAAGWLSAFQLVCSPTLNSNLTLSLNSVGLSQLLRGKSTVLLSLHLSSSGGRVCKLPASCATSSMPVCPNAVGHMPACVHAAYCLHRQNTQHTMVGNQQC